VIRRTNPVKEALVVLVVLVRVVGGTDVVSVVIVVTWLLEAEDVVVVLPERLVFVELDVPVPEAVLMPEDVVTPDVVTVEEIAVEPLTVVADVEEIEPVELARTVVVELEERLVVLERTEDVTLVVDVTPLVVVSLAGWIDCDEVIGDVVGVTGVLAVVVGSQSLHSAGTGMLLGL